MKDSKLMSVIKHIGMMACGALMVLGVVFASKVTVKAATPTYENGVLTLSGTVDFYPNGTILPSNVYASDVVSVVVKDNTTVLPDNCSDLFKGFSNITSLDLSNLSSTSNITNMHSMFEGCTSLETITFPSNLDTSNVTDMGCLFYNCNKLSDYSFLNSFNTSSVTNMGSMFGKTTPSTLDLTSFSTTNVQYMDHMFEDCVNLQTIVVNSSWSAASDCSGMFMFCYSLVGGNGTMYPSNYSDGNTFNKELARIDTPSTPGLLSLPNSLALFGQLTTDGGKFALDLSFKKLNASDSYTITYNGSSDAITRKTTSDGYEHFELCVSAKELNDAYPLIIKRGNEVLFNKSLSVADYLRRLYEISDDNPNDKNMAGIILRYGAAAQLFFNPSLPSTSLANYGLDDTGYEYNDFNFKIVPPGASAYPIDPSALNSALKSQGLTYAGINVSLDGNVMFMMALKLPQDTDYSAWAATSGPNTLKTTLGSYYNTTEFGEPKLVSDGSGKYVIVETDNINISNLDSAIYSSNAFGKEVSVVSYIANSVVTGSTDKQIRVCRALYEFHYYAKNY